MTNHKQVIVILTFFIGLVISTDLYEEIKDLSDKLDHRDVDFINNQIDKDFSVSVDEDENGIETAQKGDITDMLGLDSDDLESVDKRTLSVGGGLRSLAEMLYSQNRARRREYMSELLRQKGKRSWRFPILGQTGKRSWRFPLLGMNYLRIKPKPAKVGRSLMRRRTNQLSVSGPLSALANMLAEEGRQRKQSQSLANRMKLIELGKRKEKSYTPFEEETLADGHSDLDLDLYR